jgi:hypothetical protein
MTKLAIEDVYVELRRHNGARVKTKGVLRDLGYRFTDSTFSNMAKELLPQFVDYELETIAPEHYEHLSVLRTSDEMRATTTAKTLVFTCAQSCTHINKPFFDTLLEYCDAREAELHISRFTYNKAAFGSKSIKPGSAEESDGDDLWFDAAITPYISDTSMQVTDDLVWCGESNVSPTTMSPLTRYKTYTKAASAIIPHTKMSMESVPTMKHNDAKMLYSTGCCTSINYIKKAAGQIAEFHHVFGALVVEIDGDGNWWARQLNADADGGFHDLNSYWTSKGASPDVRIEAITHGDIHFAKLDMDVAGSVWGDGGVVDQLKPREQHFHDTVDFMARNHHNVKDPHFLHAQYMEGTDSVESEFKNAAEFITGTATRDWANDVLIVSNHDQAINTWLVNIDAIKDPVNVRYWHEMNLYAYVEREAGRTPHLFERAVRMHMEAGYQCKFVHEDDSHIITGSIECGMHGHLGASGSRGSPKGLRTAGKLNTGHTHSAGIVDGVYTCGVYGKLDMGYNKGLSGWSHSSVVTYENGKRAIITYKNGKFWRDQ